MNTKLSAIIGQYRNILATDGIVSKDELIQMLKADYEIPNNINYEKLADKILEGIEDCKPYVVSNTKKQSNKRRMELYENGFSDDEIAELEDVCPTTIYCWRKVRKLKANLTEKQRKRLEKECKMLELYNQGLSDKEIATLCDAKYSVIRGWRERNGLKANKYENKRG